MEAKVKGTLSYSEKTSDFWTSKGAEAVLVGWQNLPSWESAYCHRAAVSVDVYIFWSQALWWEEEEKENNTWSKREGKGGLVLLVMQTGHSLILPKETSFFTCSDWLLKEIDRQTHSSTNVFCFGLSFWVTSNEELKAWEELELVSPSIV